MPRTSLVPPGGPSDSVWPGDPSPLGASWDGSGVNFAVYSENATRIDVCLFDAADGPETARIRLPETEAHVFHGYVPGLRPGQLYGLRAHGPWEPEKGHRFNPHKLLVDPYAKALAGAFDPHGPVLGYRDGDDLRIDETDSARAVPKGVVIDDGFPWTDDRAPRTPWHETVIYELHVKGFTQRHPAIPPELRGRYAGLAHPAAIDHFRKLGITAVELLPIHHSVTNGILAGKGLSNYWGYDTLGYFAPDARFASEGDRGGQVHEFKAMVKALHAAGIEVILDVVYNHTCEGNHLGPTLSLRGLDNATYYRLVGDQPRYYMDYTGTGNTLNARHPQTLRLIMDSLRYWVTEMHVDGFRFDLASALARSLHAVDRLSAFFDIIHQDPILSRVKLIAEPWDVGEGGYQVGNFPLLWTEWNGKYRDAVRSYWNGYTPDVKELAYRLTGSSDLYQSDGRRPYASVNFVTAHDGFTLHDLVTYEGKHNEANGEGNADGDNNNHSTNGGVEGETDDPVVVTFRERQKRNLLSTLLLSQGVPMLVAGDEMGRTQQGNNNAYCQDNEISWLDWELDDRRQMLLNFTRRLISFRRDHPVLRRRRYFRGVRILDSLDKDLAWFRPDGVEMKPEDWNRPTRRVAFLLGGDAIPSPDPRGQRIVDDSILIVMNGEREESEFVLPARSWAESWIRVLDSEPDERTSRCSDEVLRAGGRVALGPLSTAVFLAVRKE
jgi:glycogen operon protein